MEATKIKNEEYVGAVGRRKTSVARVRITKASKQAITINDKDYEDYLPTKVLRNLVLQPLNSSELDQKFVVTVKVSGGGYNSQAEAIRHGISRTLVKYNQELRKKLKKLGYLKRDPRTKERRKFGLKKARKAPQWSKR